MNITNILGTVAAFVAIAVSLMTDIAGCSVDALGVTTCKAAWLTPAMGAYAVMLFSGIQLISKMIRPGGPLRGLFGTTAVMVPPDQAKAGVVTQAQIDAPGAKK